MENDSRLFKKEFSKEEVIRIAIALRGIGLSKYNEYIVMSRSGDIDVKDSAERGRLRKVFEVNFKFVVQDSEIDKKIIPIEEKEKIKFLQEEYREEVN